MWCKRGTTPDTLIMATIPDDAECFLIDDDVILCEYTATDTIRITTTDRTTATTTATRISTT